MKKQSPAAAVGGILVFVGLWFLFVGGSEYYGGSSTKNLYRGTVLEHNPDANRIAENAKSSGVTKLAIGLIILGIGIVVVGKSPGGMTKALDQKTCPKCAEQVKAVAKACRFCGHEF